MTHSGTNIEHLPPELLVSIFEVSTNKVGGWDPRSVISWSQVNQLWRRISLSMPQLWTTVDVRHESADAFASRSALLPISIKHILSSDSFTVCDNVVNRIQRHAHRVQDICVFANSPTILSISSAIKSIPFPLLTSLHLTSFPDSAILNFEPSENSPNLRELYLAAVYLNLDTCANLTHLHIENNQPNFYLRAFFSLLERSPRLQLLSLRNIRRVRTLLLGSDTIQLAFLERLHLQHFDPLLADVLFAYLTIPSPQPPSQDYRSWRHSTIPFDTVPDLPPLPEENEGTLEIDYAHSSIRLHGGVWHQPRDITAIPLFRVIPLIIPTFIDLTEIHVLILKDMGVMVDAAVDVWGRLLSSMSSLTHIRLCGPHGFVKNLFLALWPDLYLDSPPPERICLHLTHVYLEFDEGTDAETLGQFILDSLEAGNDAGRPPLEMLEIRSAVNMSPVMVGKLRSRVKALTLIPWISE